MSKEENKNLGIIGNEEEIMEKRGAEQLEFEEKEEAVETANETLETDTDETSEIVEEAEEVEDDTQETETHTTESEQKSEYAKLIYAQPEEEEEPKGGTVARKIVIGVVVLIAVIAVIIASKMSKTASNDNVETQTESVTETSEDLNVRVEVDGNDTNGKSAEELLGDKAIVDAPKVDDTETPLERSTEAQESLTEAEKVEVTTQETVKAEQSKKETAESKVVSTKAAETQAPQTQAPVESVPVETVPQTMDQNEFDALQNYYESKVAEQNNDEEYLRAVQENAQKMYGD